MVSGACERWPCSFLLQPTGFKPSTDTGVCFMDCEQILAQWCICEKLQMCDCCFCSFQVLTSTSRTLDRRSMLASTSLVKTELDQRTIIKVSVWRMISPLFQFVYLHALVLLKLGLDIFAKSSWISCISKLTFSLVSSTFMAPPFHPEIIVFS